MRRPFRTVLLFTVLLALGVGCSNETSSEKRAGQVGPSQSPDGPSTAEEEAEESEAFKLALPPLQPAASAGSPLRVVATTSIVGDVVGRVSESHVELTVLMASGVDPHSYTPSIGQLTEVAEADAVFVNGWDLEEGLIDDLTAIATDSPIVPVSAGIAPRLIDGNGFRQPDPHVWLDPSLVRIWASNISQVLSALDPQNATAYEGNAQSYINELDGLIAFSSRQLMTVPEPARVLVTNHDALGYFADAFGYRVAGTVVPGLSSLAEPSARDLAGLVATMETEGVCAIFMETATDLSLARNVADELETCEGVEIITLQVGALGQAGSGADSYIGMMRSNVEAIAAALGQ